MAELLTRLKHEAELNRVMKKLTAEHAEKLRRYLELGTPFEQIPAEFWDDLKRDLERDDDEKAALLLLIFLQSAEQHLRTIPLVKTNGNAMLPGMIALTAVSGAKYVGKRLRQIAPGYVRYSKVLLRSAIRQRKLSPAGDKPQIPGIPDNSPQHRRWIKETLGKMFGKDRAERMADTEAHLSGIEGGEGAIRAAKIKVVRIWGHDSDRPKFHCNSAEKPCPICSPMEGKVESEWGDRRPGACHPNDDCTILYLDEYGNKIGDEWKGSDTLERFRDRLPPGFLKDREQLYKDFPDLLESVK